MLKNKILKILIFLLPFLTISFCFAISATLFGEVTSDGGDPNLLVWFEWGKTTDLGNLTPKMEKFGVGEFAYTLSNLDPCTTYYYRAVVSHKNFDNKNYGQIKSFTTPCPKITSSQAKVLAQKAPTILKKVRNLSDGETSFSKSCYANPGETLEFQIIFDSGSGTKNTKIKDVLPQGIVFKKGTLKIDGVLTNYDIEQGVNLGDLPENVKKEITFEAQVLGKEKFAQAQTILKNVATLYFDGDQYSDEAFVSVIKKEIAGTATLAPTGIEPQIFILFLFLLILGLFFVRKILLFKFQVFLLKLKIFFAKIQLKLKIFKSYLK